MFGIGTGELLLLLVLALLVLGPERMPKLARDIGKTVADMRRTSEELRTEFLNADQALRSPERLLDIATREPTAPPAAPVEPPSLPGGAAQESVPPDGGATPTEAVTAEPLEPEETAFDREARLARERLEDPERMKEHMERAKAEGWNVPTDEAGTSPREG